jgi:predicted Zn-dependent protease with MMP-like domain
MSEEEFERLVVNAWQNVPEHFKAHIQNVALLIEPDPDEATRKEEHLDEHHTLLGLYRGIPLIARGEVYGIGATVPDTITLYREPILELAYDEYEDMKEQGTPIIYRDAVKRVIAETLWHEVGHYFGLSEEEIDEREAESSNFFKGIE